MGISITMGRLSLNERIRCTVLHQHGITISEIARRHGVSFNNYLNKIIYKFQNISRQISNMYSIEFQKDDKKLIQNHRNTGYCGDAAGQGRPRLSTNREDRILVRRSTQNRQETLPQLGWRG